MPDAISIARATGRKVYLALVRRNPDGFPYSPAEKLRNATAEAAEASGIPAARLVPVIADVFYAENGKRAPLAFSRISKKNGLPTAAAAASAVRKRRDEGGRLGRWEVIRYSYAAGAGIAPDARPSDAAIKALYAAAGGDLDRSYTGRGTRAGATATRTDPLSDLGLSDE
jgi:hypothetical protein